MRPKVCEKGKKSIQTSYQTSDNGSKLWFKQISESHFKSSSLESRVKHNDFKKLPLVGWKHSKTVESTPERMISSNVHSVTGLPTGADPSLIWQKLVQERQKNKVLQSELGRLKKSLEEKSEEIESKNELIEKLKDEKLRSESTRDMMTEDAVDIENLLDANLGDVSLTDLLSMTGANFPADLIELDLTELDKLDMMENLTCKVEIEPEQVQIPNREARNGRESSFVKTEVVEGVSVNQLKERGSMKVNVSSKNYEIQKVSTIKVKKDNQYQVAAGKRKQQTSRKQLSFTDNKTDKLYMTSDAPKSISCHTCKNKFAMRNQWKLTRHMLLVHRNTMTYSCKYCEKMFPCLSNLTAHIMAHKLTHPFQCAQCGYRLGQIREFLKHVKSAHKVTSISRGRRMMAMTKD